MAVLALAEVALGERVETVAAQRVDQHGDLDAVADRERDRLEQLPARRRTPRPAAARTRRASARAG